MTKAEEYRSFAAECVLLSERAQTSDDKLRLLTMAIRWHLLADKAVFSDDDTPPEVILNELRRVASLKRLN